MGVVPLNFIGNSDKPCLLKVVHIFIGVNYLLEMFVWLFVCFRVFLGLFGFFFVMENIKLSFCAQRQED